MNREGKSGEKVGKKWRKSEEKVRNRTRVVRTTTENESDSCLHVADGYSLINDVIISH